MQSCTRSHIARYRCLQGFVWRCCRLLELLSLIDWGSYMILSRLRKGRTTWRRVGTRRPESTRGSRLLSNKCSSHWRANKTHGGQAKLPPGRSFCREESTSRWSTRLAKRRSNPRWKMPSLLVWFRCSTCPTLHPLLHFQTASSKDHPSDLWRRNWRLELGRKQSSWLWWPLSWTHYLLLPWFVQLFHSNLENSIKTTGARVCF